MLLQTLSEVSGANSKKIFVANHADNEEFTYLLSATVDSMKKTGIKKVAIVAYPTEQVYKDKFSEFQELFEGLLVTNTNKATIDSVKTFIASCSTLEAEVYHKIITQTMKLGISTSGINAVMGRGFVSEFKIQLALSMNADTELSYPLLAEEKLNGVRVVLFKGNGVVSAMTRQGHPIRLPRIFKILEGIPDDNFVMDGELKAHGMLHKTVSIVTKLVRGTAAKGADDVFDFFAYDLIPLQTFRELRTTAPLQKRVSALEALLMANKLTGKGKVFYRPESRIVNNRQELNKFFTDIKKAGGEGLVVKDLKRTYEYCKSTAWLKYKAVYSTTLEIIGMHEGGFATKYEGMLGAFEGKSRDEVIVTNVGSGIPDDLREELWVNPQASMGKLIEVRFTDVNYTEDNEPFLDFPRYVCFRIAADKDKADTFEDILAEIKGVNDGTR